MRNGIITLLPLIVIFVILQITHFRLGKRAFTGMLFGFFYSLIGLVTIPAEPAVYVLTHQIEEVTSGQIADAIYEAYADKSGGNGMILCQDMNKAYGVK